MKAPTQDEIVLKLILDGKKVTQYYANYKLKPAISRIPAIIHKIENKGFKGYIQHTDITIKKHGRVSNVTVYHL